MGPQDTGPDVLLQYTVYIDLLPKSTVLLRESSACRNRGTRTWRWEEAVTEEEKKKEGG